MNESLTGKLTATTLVLAAIGIGALSIYWDKEPPFLT
jgi:hypothetical protein